MDSLRQLSEINYILEAMQNLPYVDIYIVESALPVTVGMKCLLADNAC